MRPLLLSVPSFAVVAGTALCVPLLAARPVALRPHRVPPPKAAIVWMERPLPPPQLIVTDSNGKEKALGLTRVDVRATIAGPLAQTSLTLTFRNDTNRVLEGNLDFPLPKKAVLSGYALDSHGVMVDGVPVEKQKARQIFETEERKGVDPGLIEQTSGNNFRTRIYPLPPFGTRTVCVRYVTDLRAVNNDLLYTVPLHWNTNVPHATFSLSVTNDPVAPELSFGRRDMLLPFTPVGAGLFHGPSHWTIEKTLENATFADDLTIRLPGLATQAQTAVEETPTEGCFFAIADAPPLAPTAPVSGLRVMPQLHLGVVWDASVSRLHSDQAHELQFLSDALRGTQTATVDVTVLRNIAEAPRRFVVTRGDSRALIAFLRGVPDDGGTDLSALRLTRGPAAFPINAYLLFTDGQDTLGGDPPTGAEAPVYAVTTDPRANHALLRSLSEHSGGTYLNLSERSDLEAVAALGQMPYSLLSVTVNGGAVAEMFPQQGEPVRGRMTLAGRLNSPVANVTVAYGYRNFITGQDQVTGWHTFTVRRADATPSDGEVARYWARQKAAALAQESEKNHDALIALGSAFNIVTPDTSLLVLDTLQQYVEHNVEPPASLPELRREWTALRANHDKEQRTERVGKFNQVSQLWREKVDWYEHTPKTTRILDREGITVNILGSERIRAVGGRRSYAYLNTASTANASSTVSNDADNASLAMPPSPVAATTGVAAGRTVHSIALESVDGTVSTTRGSIATTSPAIARPAAAHLVGSVGPGSIHLNASVSMAKAGLDSDALNDLPAIAGETVTIKAWSPDTPYLKVLRAAGPAGAYDAYLRERTRGGYENSPAFYLDCAEYLIAQGQNALGVRVLTSILDLRLEEPSLVRVVAHRLVQLGYRDAGIRLFAQVKQLRPEEPQSYRDLALALSDRAHDEVASGKVVAAATDDNQALALLNVVVTRPWDGRFPEIETIALMEANRIAARARANPRLASLILDPIDPQLTQNLPCDLRIVLTWNTDETDQDLWVTEPTGEKCYYAYNRTRIGGRLSHDFTQGYGPEEYLLRRSVPGKYLIQTNYYGQHSPEIDGGTTVQATVITNWGRPSEQRRYLTVRVNQAKDVVDIGSVVR